MGWQGRRWGGRLKPRVHGAGCLSASLPLRLPLCLPCLPACATPHTCHLHRTAAHVTQDLPGMAALMKAGVTEGLRQGVAGAIRDLQVRRHGGAEHGRHGKCLPHSAPLHAHLPPTAHASRSIMWTVPPPTCRPSPACTSGREAPTPPRRPPWPAPWPPPSPGPCCTSCQKRLTCPCPSATTAPSWGRWRRRRQGRRGLWAVRATRRGCEERAASPHAAAAGTPFEAAEHLHRARGDA